MRRLTAVVLVAILTFASTAGAEARRRIATRRTSGTATAGDGNLNAGVRNADQTAPPRVGQPGAPGSRTLVRSRKTKRVWTEPETCADLGGDGVTRIRGSVWSCGADGSTVYQKPTCYGGALCPQDTRQPGTDPTDVAPEPDIGALVGKALKQVPLPYPMMSPPVEDDGVEHVVGLPFFFGIPAAYWRPITTTATDGFSVVTITATPSALSFAPGDGSAETKRCDGPGRRVLSMDAAQQAKRTGCYYLYQIASPANAEYDATLSITWTLGVITNIVPATLVTVNVPPTMTTTTNIGVPVIEIQPVLAPVG